MEKENNNKTTSRAKDTFARFKKSRVYSFVLILVAIAVCILIGMGIAFYQHANNPTDEGSKYLRAFIMQDYNTMYKLVDKDNKISKEKFIEKMRSMFSKILITAVFGR